MKKGGAKRKASEIKTDIEDESQNPAINKAVQPLRKRQRLTIRKGGVKRKASQIKMEMEEDSRKPAINKATRPLPKRVEAAKPEAEKRKGRQMGMEEASRNPPINKATRSSGKRVKAAKPEPKPEPEEPRNLEDLWKAAFALGTGWEQLDSVHGKFKWDFSNLEHAFEEGGKLHHDKIGNKNKVYIFAKTESFTPREAEGEVLFPVVVVILSPSPPSEELSLRPVDSRGGGEEIRVPMKSLKMDWIPYFPLDNSSPQTQIFVLGCTHRRAALKHLQKNENCTAKFEYSLPYLDEHKDEEDQHNCWALREMDGLAKFIVNELIEKDEELFAVVKAGLKEYVQDKLYEEKRKHLEEVRQSQKKTTSRVQEDAPEEAEGFRNMKIYKLYPVQTPETPDLSKARFPFINRYYGKAHEVL